MIPPLTTLAKRLDTAYGEEPYFVLLKARLLAAFALLLLVFVPLNIGKLLWVQPPGLEFRFAFNLTFILAGLLALHWVRRGRLPLAGNAMVLSLVVPNHILLFLVPVYAQPLSAAIQLFVADLVFLLLALVFASRRVAIGTLLVIVASHIAFHALALRGPSLAGSMDFAAATMLRDGLITIGFVFCLGFTLSAILEAAHQRSDQALRATRATNENLSRLVAERTSELEAATHRASEAARAKGDFLANMSHEIRTPLNGIIASADLLQHRPDLPPAAAEHARLITESGDLLLNLLGDILDFSKIEAGQLSLEWRPFALASLVADNVSVLAAKAAQGGVAVEVSVHPALPRHFEGDNFRLRQILLNLMSNAVKFTPAGGRVRITVTADGPSVGDLTPVRFEVRDTGIGMDAAAMQRLFERFTQADSSTTRRYGGTGLGLAISLHLVTLMGGRLEAESTPAEGSTFHFTIPLRGVGDVPVIAPAQMDAPLQLGLHVLVVEDNAINRKILTAQLKKLGCQCTLAPDGAAALIALEQEPLPDLVLMDCHMPQLDGWETTLRIRAWASSPHSSPIQRRVATLPIIALTAAALPEERTHCLAVGMTDFLSKPVKLADLQRMLQPLLGAPI